MYNNIVAIVLNHRTPEKTIKCLRCLVDQHISRIILVENSEDEGITIAKMQSGLDSLTNNQVSIKIINNNKNLGFSAGVNIALESGYIYEEDAALLINSDAYLENDSLMGLVKAINAGADVAAPMVSEPNQPLRAPVFYYQKHFALLTRNYLPGSFPYITGACMLLSSRVKEMKLFDEDFFFYGEDVMLGAKMLKQKRSCQVVATSIAVHEGAGSSRNGSLFYEYHINRGHWLLAQKLNQSKIDHHISLAGRWLTLATRALLRSVRYKSLNPIKGFWNSRPANKKQHIRPS